MITLTKKLKEAQEGKSETTRHSKRISIRDKLLSKEVPELESNLPDGVKIKFDDPHVLHTFTVIVSPVDGFWASGTFHFSVKVPEDYNIVPPTVKCETRLWHPNINENGEICLSLLRQNSIDSLGWAPTRRLKDVVWGLNSLFSDLLNFEDPLNIEAAEHYKRDSEAFISKVEHYIHKYCPTNK